jgi:RES domain-containing protein
LISVWRIGYCPTPQPTDAEILSTLGRGSTFGNGRWHTKGPPELVYAGSTRSLCQLEKRVHSNGANPKDQALMRLDLPDGAPLLDVLAMGLPADWRTNEAITQSLSMAWLNGGASLGLWVPSFIEPDDRNLLINPLHPAYAAIRLTVERNPFKFDPRLFAT